MSNITGVSFPFRLGVNGGLVMSTTSQTESKHLNESIFQILQTFKYDRPRESHFYSSIDSFVFAGMDESDVSLLKYFICDALKLDTRIIVKEGDITVYPVNDKGEIPVDIRYRRTDNGLEVVTSMNLNTGGA